MSQSEQIDQLATALAKAQGSMQNAVMNRTNPHFRSKYADLSSVLDAIRSPLATCGLAVVQTMQAGERGMVLKTTLMHASGQFITTEYPLPATQKPHEMGSALTYARRYSLAALICNASDEDDDGNMAMAGKPEAANAPPSPRIGTKDLDQVRQLIDETGTDIAALCRYFKIGSLMEITPVMLPNIVAALNAKKAPVANAAE
jgi:hypothetical protein